jgi:hypothetical protein
VVEGPRRLDRVAWSYPKPLAGAERPADCMVFEPTLRDCRADPAALQAQPGGFYGGWITPELAGPLQGGAGCATTWSG